MPPSNKEIQLRTTCQIYAYVLKSQGKEVYEDLQDCADSYEYPIDCVEELAKEIKSLDEKILDSLMNNENSELAYKLKSWWFMYQEMQNMHNNPGAYI